MCKLHLLVNTFDPSERFPISRLWLCSSEDEDYERERKVSYLFPPRRKFRIPSDASLDVVVALPVSTQVDGVGVHVDVHEVVNYLALNVVLHPVHQKTLSHVDNLDEREVPVGANEMCLLSPSGVSLL